MKAAKTIASRVLASLLRFCSIQIFGSRRRVVVFYVLAGATLLGLASCEARKQAATPTLLPAETHLAASASPSSLPRLMPTATSTPAPTTPTPLGHPSATLSEAVRAPETLTPGPPPQTSPSPEAANADQVLIAAGDIASCVSTGDEATAQLVEAMTGTVATLGDNVYQSGTGVEFDACYEPSWGKFKARTRPAPGNHDYETPDASGYFDYFGAAAGEPGKGYYSYDLGAWHMVVLNSSCWAVGGCAAGSPQEQWLRADLAAHPAECTLAYWHHPLFTSGPHGNFITVQPLWQALYEAGADVVLNGHDHDYERFAPQDPHGAADPAHGLREFVVGTGGRSHYHFSQAIRPNSEVRNADTFGVLKLTLHPAGYDWAFIPEAGKTFTDSGSAPCH